MLPALGYLPQIPQSKFKLLSSVPCLYPGEVNKLAIRGCFCLPAHPINDNLWGVNNVQADASGMLREFQLIPQKATLLWQVPLQKDPESISAKWSSFKGNPCLTLGTVCEPVTAVRGLHGIGKQGQGQGAPCLPPAPIPKHTQHLTCFHEQLVFFTALTPNTTYCFIFIPWARYCGALGTG